MKNVTVVIIIIIVVGLNIIRSHKLNSYSVCCSWWLVEYKTLCSKM